MTGWPVGKRNHHGFAPFMSFFYAAVFIFRFIVVAVYFNRYSALDPGQNRFRDLVFKSCPKRRYDTTTLGPLV